MATKTKRELELENKLDDYANTPEANFGGLNLSTQKADYKKAYNYINKFNGELGKLLFTFVEKFHNEANENREEVFKSKVKDWDYPNVDEYIDLYNDIKSTMLLDPEDIAAPKTINKIDLEAIIIETLELYLKLKNAYSHMYNVVDKLKLMKNSVRVDGNDRVPDYVEPDPDDKKGFNGGYIDPSDEEQPNDGDNNPDGNNPDVINPDDKKVDPKKGNLYDLYDYLHYNLGIRDDVNRPQPEEPAGEKDLDNNPDKNKEDALKARIREMRKEGLEEKIADGQIDPNNPEELSDADYELVYGVSRKPVVPNENDRRVERENNDREMGPNEDFRDFFERKKDKTLDELYAEAERNNVKPENPEKPQNPQNDKYGDIFRKYIFDNPIRQEKVDQMWEDMTKRMEEKHRLEREAENANKPNAQIASVGGYGWANDAELVDDMKGLIDLYNTTRSFINTLGGNRFTSEGNNIAITINSALNNVHPGIINEISIALQNNDTQRLRSIANERIATRDFYNGLTGNVTYVNALEQALNNMAHIYKYADKNKIDLKNPKEFINRYSVMNNGRTQQPGPSGDQSVNPVVTPEVTGGMGIVPEGNEPIYEVVDEEDDPIYEVVDDQEGLTDQTPEDTTDTNPVVPTDGGSGVPTDTNPKVPTDTTPEDTTDGGTSDIPENVPTEEDPSTNPSTPKDGMEDAGDVPVEGDDGDIVEYEPTEDGELENAPEENIEEKPVTKKKDGFFKRVGKWIARRPVISASIGLAAAGAAMLVSGGTALTMLPTVVLAGAVGLAVGGNLTKAIAKGISPKYRRFIKKYDIDKRLKKINKLELERERILLDAEQVLGTSTATAHRKYAALPTKGKEAKAFGKNVVRTAERKTLDREIDGSNLDLEGVNFKGRYKLTTDAGKLERMAKEDEKQRKKLSKQFDELEKLYVKLGDEDALVRDNASKRYFTEKRQASDLEKRVREHASAGSASVLTHWIGNNPLAKGINAATSGVSQKDVKNTDKHLAKVVEEAIQTGNERVALDYIAQDIALNNGTLNKHLEKVVKEQYGARFEEAKDYFTTRAKELVIQDEEKETSNAVWEASNLTMNDSEKKAPVSVETAEETRDKVRELDVKFANARQKRLQDLLEGLKPEEQRKVVKKYNEQMTKNSGRDYFNGM